MANLVLGSLELKLLPLPPALVIRHLTVDHYVTDVIWFVYIFIIWLFILSLMMGQKIYNQSMPKKLIK